MNFKKEKRAPSSNTLMVAVLSGTTAFSAACGYALSLVTPERPPHKTAHVIDWENQNYCKIPARIESHSIKKAGAPISGQATCTKLSDMRCDDLQSIFTQVNNAQKLANPQILTAQSDQKGQCRYTYAHMKK